MDALKGFSACEKPVLQIGLLSLAAALLLFACGTQDVPPTISITTSADLVRVLRAAGAEVENSTAGRVLPSLPGDMLRVDGEPVQIGDLASDGADIQAQIRESAGDPVRQSAPLVWTGPGWYAIYDGRDGGLILLLSGLLGDPLRSTPAPIDEPFPPAVPFAMRTLAEALDREPQEVFVLGYNPVIWPDTCLGLGRPGEACAQVETPGWLIQVSLDASVYNLHSNDTGDMVRWAEPPLAP